MADQDRFYSLDGLRGIAAITVAVFHCDSNLLPGGNLAVDFFFCLSGFVIAMSYGGKLSQGMTPRHFIELRIARLYPMILLGSLLGLVLLGGNPGILLLIPDPRAMSLFPSNTPFWSLLDELVINLVFAVLLFRLHEKWLLVILVASAVLLAWLVLLGPQGTGYGWKWSGAHIGLVRTAYAFVGGMLLHRLWVYQGRQRRTSYWALALPLLFLAVSISGLMAREIGMLVGIVVIIPGLVWAGINLDLPCKTLCKNMGDLSYPLYCIHAPIIFYVPENVQIRLAAAGGCVVLALLIDRYYDSPIRAWLGALARRRAMLPHSGTTASATP